MKRHFVRDGLKTRMFRVGSYSVAAAVFVIAIAVVINLLAGAIPAKYTQFDTTSNQLFSISDQTEKILSGLTEEVTVYWIVRDGSEDDTIELLLNQYEERSANIHVVKKDPDVYPTFVQQYTESYYDNSLIVESGTRSRYVDYYEIYEYDYSNYYTNYTYEVNFAGESALTSAIDYVINDSLPKIYVLSGHGESDLPSSYTEAIEKQNMETESLSLLTLESVPEDADAVLVYAPQSDLSEEETEQLRTYLQGGGSLLLITEPPEDGTLTNLESLMGDYGVSAAEGIVVEGSQDNYVWNAPYYLLPTIKSHDITESLQDEGYYVLLPVAQGLSVSEDAVPENATVTELLTTSSDAFSKIAGWNLDTYEKEDGDLDGPFALAVAVEDSVSDDATAHVVWISSASVADESANQIVSGGNQDFFLNALSWMCERDESTLAIHSKSLSYEYLTIPSSSVSLLSVLMVGLIPLLYLGIGVVVRMRRKRR